MKHEIKKTGYYSISDILEYELISISKRLIQLYAKKHSIKIIDKSYLFTGYQILEMIALYERKAKKKAKKEELENANKLKLKLRSFQDVEITTPPQIEFKGVKKEIIDLITDIDNDEYLLKVLIAIKDDKHLEEFSDEEYDLFRDRLKTVTALEKRIIEYKEEINRMENYVLDYRNNIEYLKKSLDKRADETAIILKTIEQRNYLEAKDKNFDKR